MTFFHANATQREQGEIISPGNWSRIVKEAGEQHPYWTVEQVFERVRLSRYAHLPSRLASCFGCPTLEQLRFFVWTSFRDDPNPHYLYEVKKQEPDAPEHVTDFALIKVHAPGETLEGQAERYWQGNFRYTIRDSPKMACEEILTPSALVVVREVGVMMPRTTNLGA
jgi:hypothetical protein